MGDPLLGFLQWLGGKLAMTGAARLSLRDQAGMFQDVNVFHHRRERHAVRLCEFSNRGLPEHECGENGAAGGIGERAKGRIEGCGILNHVV